MLIRSKSWCTLMLSVLQNTYMGVSQFYILILIRYMVPFYVHCSVHKYCLMDMGPICAAMLLGHAEIHVTIPSF